MKQRFLIPLAVFFVLLIFLAIGLTLNPRDVPSPLKDKPAPAFKLPQLAAADKSFSPDDMKGKVWLLNVWSSWCVSCRAEHPLLVAFAKQSQLPIVGLSYKEVRGDGDIDTGKMQLDDELKLTRQRANAWLAQRGDPYSVVALDLDGRVGIDYGVYGVPETYVIDKAGTIRMKHTGPITPESLQKQILPLVAELSK
jgi:cytochrome c biogenesis protein CcmG/thiol:disulfide interchange protein DsbE